MTPARAHPSPPVAPSSRPRGALPWGAILGVLSALPLGACCGKKDRGPEAKAYGAALEAHKERLAEAVAALGALEKRLAPLRASDPGAAARLVTAEALPLVDRMVASADEPLAKGAAWRKALKKPASQGRLERALLGVSRQKEALARLRASYAEEAALLARGAPAAADLSRLLGARGIIALQAIARPPKPKGAVTGPARPAPPR